MTTTLVCQECRRENEPERIYCHDCGARLDRSALAKGTATAETPEQAHQRVKSIFSPHGARLRAFFFKISKVILGALATAAAIQMLLPPEVAPKSKGFALFAQISMDMEEAARTHSPAQLRYSEEQVNSYLGTTLKNKQSTLNGIMQFDRAFVKLDEKSCKLTVARSLYGVPFYSSGTFRVALENHNVVSETVAGGIGRMPIHPALMKYCGFLFNDVAAALDRERKSLAKLSGIEFHPQTVIITP